MKQPIPAMNKLNLANINSFKENDEEESKASTNIETKS
jgi:hypothetical protein